MERYTFARRALSAMPTTPDDVVFLAAVFVAFGSGALLLHWIRRVRDIGLQKQWHDAQIKILQEGFATFEQLPQQLNAINASIGELREKADGATDRFNTICDRINDLSQNGDHLQTVGAGTHDVKRPSIVQPTTDVSSADANELMAVKSHIKNLESKMSEITKRKDELEQANVSLKEDLERATKSDGEEQSDEYKTLLKQNEELQTQVAQTERSLRILEQEKERVAANGDPAMKQQEEVIKIYENDIEGLEERLALAQKDRTTAREETKQMSSELEELESKLSTAQSDQDEMRKENLRLSSEVSELETSLSSARSDQQRMAQEIQNHLAVVQRLRDDLSSAEHERDQQREANESLAGLNENTGQPEADQSAIVDLKEKLKAESLKSADLKVRNDVLTKDIGKNEAHIETMKADEVQNKQQLDRLTSQVESLERQKMDLEATLEEHSQAKESEDQAEEHGEGLQDNNSSDAPEQRDESQPDMTKLPTSPQQSNKSGTAPDDSWVEVAAQPPTAPDGKPTTDGESAEVDEALSPVVKLPMAPVVEASGRPATRKSWADDDEQDFDPEIQRFAARTASLPSAPSSTNSPAQESPGSPAPKPQPTIDTSVANNASGATTPHSNASSLPVGPSPTSDTVTALCKYCDIDVPVDMIQLPNGRRYLDWPKHSRETDLSPDKVRVSRGQGGFK
ncbi:hypothetical protein J4E83_005926 [Alternaria metachromatica]|uniref:uncharacterized protein n=1 Tax=Alternaria metachromatica TaxID=283354 RepID=UPI0020C5397E|nr:uncharacterized protein J4E83_005926 [Alternaria metachromatica]KAI4618975.1 hypothetical protein J4E83_005926 [Alternaria metachromatica]